MTTQTAEHPKVPIRLVVRVGVAVVVLVGVILLISGSHETQTVSQVIENVHKVALAKPGGGLIGPWWVSAQSYDAEAGRLRDFKMECDPVRIAARSTRVVVNPHADSFQLEMWDVVVARVPQQEGLSTEHDLLELDRYLLGPIPYGVDIVPDK